ncbi:hypothetical protein M8J76_000799 [Diaphorina citri]|nr:hypothetical protein M8J76_000799 [Diaphorina citri]
MSSNIESQVSTLINDILKVDYIEEAFSCYIIHKLNTQKDRLKCSISEFCSVFQGIPPETQELGIKQFLVLAGNTNSHSRKGFLFNVLEQLVADNVLPARLVCECILSSDKLQYKNEDFWIKSFQLVRKIIGGVDYKGVREIMKICCEKACAMPPVLTANVAPQFKALENVIQYIFDRNACLLPSYFIVNELQKAYPEHRANWPHWKLSNLLSGCVASFRATAQMVSIIGLSEMLPVVEHSGYAETQINPWRLDPVTLKFSLKGNLPYDASLLKPQTKLLRYVLEQPYSRDMVCSLLGLQKTQKNRCVALEEQLVELLIVAMERSEAEACCPPSSSHDATSPPSHTLWLWLHLSSQLIYFVLFQFAKFPNIVQSLYDKLSVLLQFISGSIQRNPLNNFLPVLKLYDLLYSEKEPLRVPDHNQPLCTHQMAMTCIWIHLIKKAQTDSQTQIPGGNVTLSSLQRSIPNTLKLHHEFLQQLAPPGINSQPATLGMEADYRTALLCNAYSTNQDYFSRPMAALVETILGGQKSHQQGAGGGQAGGPGGWSNPALAHGPTVPLSMHILDALTVHAKMSLIHSIVTHVIKLAQQQLKANVSLAPALVETYSRLLVYTEIESLVTRVIKLAQQQLKANVSLAPALVETYSRLLVYTEIESLVTHVIKLAQQQLKANVSLAPALVETYSRLLVYTEIESLVTHVIKLAQQQLKANVSLAPALVETYSRLLVYTEIESLVTHVIKLAQQQLKANVSLAPALVETYSRLLVYTEFESLGIKGFISQLLPTVFKSHAWGILFTLLEMFSYRMHHIQPHYRVQLLSHLHSLAAVPQTNKTQLHLCVESTALRLITGLGSSEVQPQLSRFISEPKTLVSSESEELNRALVLTLARSMHIIGTGNDPISGSWCKDILMTIMQNTPHSWANHTLESFPPVLNEFFQQNTVPKENKLQLKKAVEEEYRNWSSMTNENDIIAHFSAANTPPLFLCLLWQMVLETDRINPIVYKILEKIGARALSAHLRKFCDYLVFKFANSEEGKSQRVNKCVDAINSMIWKYNIVTIDRLVCFFIIQLLLFKAAEFRNRVSEFVKENSPEHWKQSDWHEKHLAFHQNYPEKFAPEGILDQSGSSPYQSLPVYFGNVCLRFLPVFDIVIHRYLDLPPVTKSLETLLEHLGCLYKFHDRPITYLYNTLHYFDKKLRDRLQLKRKLVYAVLASLCEIRPPGWSLSDQYLQYMSNTGGDKPPWIPDLDYYIYLVKRVVDTLNGDPPFPPTDWRFNEFPNPAAHALYVTCVELMGLPVPPEQVGNALLDVIMRGYTVIASDQIHAYINVLGLLMSALPDPYWTTLQDRLIRVISSPALVQGTTNCDIFALCNFNRTHNTLLGNQYAYTLALTHSLWHHAGLGQISCVPQFIKKRLAPCVKSEQQFIFLCHVIGPFLQRFNSERPKAVMDLTVTLYNALESVDKNSVHMSHMDEICDLLYHIKYMFVGDLMKSEVEGIIRKLRPALQMRLRFISHLNIDEIISNT